MNKAWIGPVAAMIVVGAKEIFQVDLASADVEVYINAALTVGVGLYALFTKIEKKKAEEKKNV
jgi:hypothetical protein